MWKEKPIPPKPKPPENRSYKEGGIKNIKHKQNGENLGIVITIMLLVAIVSGVFGSCYYFNDYIPRKKGNEICRKRAPKGSREINYDPYSERCYYYVWTNEPYQKWELYYIYIRKFELK